MPGVTPNFAIPYPCAGETIDASVFQDFADGVEAALQTVEASVAASLQRPRAAMNLLGQSIPVGVITPLVFTTTEFSSGVTSAAGGFTIIEDGVYSASLNVAPTNFTTTVTSWEAHIRRAGLNIYSRKVGRNPAEATANRLNNMGLFTATAGQLISFAIAWTGAGVNIAWDCRATIAKISNP